MRLACLENNKGHKPYRCGNFTTSAEYYQRGVSPASCITASTLRYKLILVLVLWVRVPLYRDVEAGKSVFLELHQLERKFRHHSWNPPKRMLGQVMAN